jgi:hypothetical protein
VVDFKCTYFNEAAFLDPGEKQFGNVPRYFANLHQPGVANVDFSLIKNISLGEKRRLQLRGASFSALRPTHFGAPSTGFCKGNGCGFGTSASTCNDPRKMQMGARFEF